MDTYLTGLSWTDHPRSHGCLNSKPLPVARPTYYPSPSPQTHRQHVQTQLGIAMFNAWSLMNKIDQLNNFASLNYIDAIGVTDI